MLKVEGINCSKLKGSSSYSETGPKSVPMSINVALGSGTGTASWRNVAVSLSRVFKSGGFWTSL